MLLRLTGPELPPRRFTVLAKTVMSPSTVLENMPTDDNSSVTNDPIQQYGTIEIKGDPYEIADITTSGETAEWRALAETLRADADVLEKAHWKVAHGEWSVDKAATHIARHTRHGTDTFAASTSDNESD